MVRVWNEWILTSTATTTACSTPAIWYDWVASSTNTSVTSGVLWRQWVTTSGSGEYRYRAPTAEERAAQEQRLAERRAQEAAAREQAQAAKERAERLLLARLPERQRRQRKKEGFFDVKGSAGRLYRIHTGTHGNVRELERQADGTLRAIASLCCQPRAVPEADAHLAQYLWLKHDEETFRRVANITRYTQPPALA